MVELLYKVTPLSIFIKLKAFSPFTGERVNRFLHITQNREDVVLQNKMQRRLGQLTGTCFQRCVGMDAFNSLYSTSFEIGLICSMICWQMSVNTM